MKNPIYPKVSRSVYFHLVFVFVLLASSLNAQNEVDTLKRPKVGLVLSGGGAKGLAHIGVLKVLEEAGIQPDYITGTSMGSIIGGLYAIGYSASELDSIIRGIDWSVTMSDKIPLHDVKPVEKTNYNRFQLEFEVNEKGLSLPKGMVQGQRISELMSQLSWRVSGIDNFDDFPIPFRCVAADLISGQKYVFKSGDLMTAMRASMAIPSVFAPVQIDSLYLVDGGVLDNYPVQVCKDMGAEIIIGVNVNSSDKPSAKDLSSIVSVLTTSAMIGSNNSLPEAIKQTDVLISPELKPYSTGSFSDAVPIIQRGEESARMMYDQIKFLADSINDLGPVPEVKKVSDPGKVKIQKVSIHGLKNVTSRFIMANMRFEEGDSITVEDVNNGLNRLIGTRFIEKVTYTLDRNGSAYTLHLFPQEASRVKAGFSLRYDNVFKAGLIANLTARNFIIDDSRWSITADISETPRLESDIYTYLGEQQRVAYFVYGNYERTPLPIYDHKGSKRGSFKYNQLGLGMGFTFSFATKYKVITLVDWKRMILRSQSGLGEIFDAGVKQFGNEFVKANLALHRNTFDSRYFVNTGSSFILGTTYNIHAEEVYSGEPDGQIIVEEAISIPVQNFFQVGVAYTHYQPIGNKFNLQSNFSGGLFTHDVPFLNLFYVGGSQFNARMLDIPFIGLNYRERMTEDFAMGKFSLRYHINKIFYYQLIVNALYNGQFHSNRFEGFPLVFEGNEFILGYGATLAIKSVIGPIGIGAGSNFTDSRLRWYVNVGFPF
jgi:NTE family protein